MRYNASCLFVDLRPAANNFDSFSTRACGWFEDVDVFVSPGLTINAELAVVVWHYVCLWAETIFSWVALEHSLSSLDVFPHQIFSAKLE